MNIGTKVKVINKNQVNYPLKGIVIENETSPEGIKMSKVKFSHVECWYADEDLKIVKKTITIKYCDECFRPIGNCQCYYNLLMRESQQYKKLLERVIKETHDYATKLTIERGLKRIEEDWREISITGSGVPRDLFSNPNSNKSQT